MPKSRSEPTSPELGSFPAAVIGPLIAANQQGMMAAQEIQAQFLKQLGEFNEEFGRFFDRRLEEEQHAFKDLAACETPVEIFAVYGDFLETAVEQFTEETGTLTNAIAEQASKAFEAMQSQVGQAVEPLQTDDE